MASTPVVKSSLGELRLDGDGVPVGVVRMDVERSYSGLGELLQRVIDDNSDEAWQAIRRKIDYTYKSLDAALSPLDEVTDFRGMLKAETSRGKKLLFKPNLVNPMGIELQTHGEGMGYVACTSWAFIAALMRWFHDGAGVTYHQMAIGEAATAMSAMAARASLLTGQRITTEAIIEGESGRSYGGWGFFFVRRYLAENHDPSHSDDPMKGFEDSVDDNYVPPGRALDRLPVYDLNRIQDMPSKGRDIPVPNGANFQTITVHKAIVGAGPNDPEDMRDYPGSVIINVPKMKVHTHTIMTNAFKNLGIGLYPMEVAHTDGPQSTDWKYSSPAMGIPGMKARIPHQVWVPEVDDCSGKPKFDTAGNVIVKQTAGINGTMTDIVSAVMNQGVKVLSVADAVEPTNVDHMSGIMGLRVPEGMAFASLDPVALDLACARYFFKTVPMAEARTLQHEFANDFLQRVPVPVVENGNIVSKEGVDSPLSRCRLFDYAADRGTGQTTYHVIGRDLLDGSPLASLQGHLGRVKNGEFIELLTETLYFGAAKGLWDLQKMVLAYAEANDKLTGSDYRQTLLDAFDDNGDGIIEYDHMGKKAIAESGMFGGGYAVHLSGMEPHGFLRGNFVTGANSIRWSDSSLNGEGLDFTKEARIVGAAMLGWQASQLPFEGADAMNPGMTWGNGKWPSIQFAQQMALGVGLYGKEFPLGLNVISLWGMAFQYSDRQYNGSRYTKDAMLADQASVQDYVGDLAKGAKPLPFVLNVPVGYTQYLGGAIPNVCETSEVAKLFTAEFAEGKEVWRGD